MLAAAEGWGAGEGERPYLPRAFSFARAREGRLRSSSCSRTSARAPHRLARLGEGDGLWLTGPLGIGFDAPRTRRADPRRRRHRSSPPALPPGRAGRQTPRVLLGFRTAAHAEAATLFAGNPAIATDDGSAGPPRARHRATREPSSTPTRPRTVFACGPPPMLEAVRALAPSARWRPSWRWSQAWPAASAPASAASSPRGTATCGSASTARCSTPTSSRPRSSPGAGH